MLTPLGPHSLEAQEWVMVINCSGLVTLLDLVFLGRPPFCPARPFGRPSMPNSTRSTLTRGTGVGNGHQLLRLSDTPRSCFFRTSSFLSSTSLWETFHAQHCDVRANTRGRVPLNKLLQFTVTFSYSQSMTKYVS